MKTNADQVGQQGHFQVFKIPREQQLCLKRSFYIHSSYRPAANQVVSTRESRYEQLAALHPHHAPRAVQRKLTDSGSFLHINSFINKSLNHPSLCASVFLVIVLLKTGLK